MGTRLDDRIRKVLEELDAARDSHPNVAVMWRSYIIQKVQRLSSEIDMCEHMLDNVLPEMSDMPLTTMLLFSSVQVSDSTTT